MIARILSAEEYTSLAIYKLTIEFAPGKKPVIETALVACGPLSFLEGRLASSGTVDEERYITLYTENGEQASHLIGAFEEELKNLGGGAADNVSALISVELEELADESWKTNWQEYWAPIEVSERLLVAPYDAPLPEVRSGQKVIWLRSELTFGTGGHPTTRMCLRFIDQLFAQKRIMNCLDFGCGTGVLALAAAALGSEATGIDCDEEAVLQSRANAELNGLTAVRFSNERLSAIDENFDLLTANVISSVLIAEWKELLVHCRSGGYLIVSGMLAQEEDEFLQSVKLAPRERREEEEWLAFLFEL